MSEGRRRLAADEVPLPLRAGTPGEPAALGRRAHPAAAAPADAGAAEPARAGRADEPPRHRIRRGARERRSRSSPARSSRSRTTATSSTASPTGSSRSTAACARPTAATRPGSSARPAEAAELPCRRTACATGSAPPSAPSREEQWALLCFLAGRERRRSTSANCTPRSGAPSCCSRRAGIRAARSSSTAGPSPPSPRISTTRPSARSSPPASTALVPETVGPARRHRGPAPARPGRGPRVAVLRHGAPRRGARRRGVTESVRRRRRPRARSAGRR